MPRRRPKPLPEALQYLQPVVNWLSAIPADSLNEDTGTLRLEKALRRRLQGLKRGAAKRLVKQDTDLLESWLETQDSQNHPARYVFAFLQACLLWAHTPGLDILDSLAKRPVQPKYPVVKLETPKGWKVRIRSGALDLTKGKWLCSVDANGEDFEFAVRSRDATAEWLRRAPHLEATTDVLDVQFGDCAGKKYLYRQTAPFPWKRVNYVLRVPGGYVSILLDMGGANFDESPLEAKFHTLRIRAQN